MRVDEYVKKEIEESEFCKESDIGKVIHYSWCEHDEMAEILEMAAAFKGADKTYLSELSS